MVATRYMWLFDFKIIKNKSNKKFSSSPTPATCVQNMHQHIKFYWTALLLKKSATKFYRLYIYEYPHN